MELCAATRAQSLANAQVATPGVSGYVASDMDSAVSSVSLLQVYQMGLFPGASCWFALVKNSTA